MKDFFKSIKFFTTPPKPGCVLIAEPLLQDPNFVRSVVLIIAHNEEGTYGLTLNRPLSIDTEMVFENLELPPLNLYEGGPVGLGEMFYLHRLGDKIPESVQLMPNVYCGGDFEAIRSEIMIQGEENFRFFAGYAGWGPGQLEQEIKEKSWIVANIESRLIWDADAKIWQEALSSLGNN